MSSFNFVYLFYFENWIFMFSMYFFFAFITVKQFFMQLRHSHWFQTMGNPNVWSIQSKIRSNFSIRHRSLGEVTSLVSKSTNCFPKLDPPGLSYQVAAAIRRWALVNTRSTPLLCQVLFVVDLGESELSFFRSSGKLQDRLHRTSNPPPQNLMVRCVVGRWLDKTGVAKMIDMRLGSMILKRRNVDGYLSISGPILDPSQTRKKEHREWSLLSRLNPLF